MKQDETYVKCNICGADDSTVLFEEGKAQVHRIVKCNGCGFIYANPQTDNVSDVEKDHLKSHSNDNTATGFEQFNPENHQYLKKQFLQLRDYSAILDFTDHKEKGTMVEIGSYAGVFLNEARKRGWNVIGIEPLEIPSLYAEEKFGIRVIRKYFEQADIEAGSIDVIVACHVIEHVPDPSAFVEKAHEFLKNDGYLILETPAYDSMMFKLLRHRERSVRCDGHIYFFTRKSLTRLVEDHGFKVLKYEKVGRTLTMGRFFTNLGIVTGKKELFSRLSDKLNLDRHVIRINLRDMQRIYCSRK